MFGDRPVVIAGAGSIGCFVGGMLAAAGRDVALLARPRVIEEIATNGLRLTGFDGLDRRVAPGGWGWSVLEVWGGWRGGSQLRLSEDPAILTGAGVVLVTVKSADSA